MFNGYGVLVEGSEKQFLWQEYNKMLDWPGMGGTAHYHLIKTVKVDDEDWEFGAYVFADIINGQTVYFVEPHGRYRSWEAVNDWMKEQFPEDRICNAINFGHCILWLRDNM